MQQKQPLGYGGISSGSEHSSTMGSSTSPSDSNATIRWKEISRLQDHILLSRTERLGHGNLEFHANNSRLPTWWTVSETIK